MWSFFGLGRHVRRGSGSRPSARRPDGGAVRRQSRQAPPAAGQDLFRAFIESSESQATQEDTARQLRHVMEREHARARSEATAPPSRLPVRQPQHEQRLEVGSAAAGDEGDLGDIRFADYQDLHATEVWREELQYDEQVLDFIVRPEDSASQQPTPSPWRSQPFTAPSQTFDDMFARDVLPPSTPAEEEEEEEEEDDEEEDDEEYEYLFAQPRHPAPSGPAPRHQPPPTAGQPAEPAYPGQRVYIPLDPWIAPPDCLAQAPVEPGPSFVNSAETPLPDLAGLLQSLESPESYEGDDDGEQDWWEKEVQKLMAEEEEEEEEEPYEPIEQPPLSPTWPYIHSPRPQPIALRFQDSIARWEADLRLTCRPQGRTVLWQPVSEGQGGWSVQDHQPAISSQGDEEVEDEDAEEQEHQEQQQEEEEPCTPPPGLRDRRATPYPPAGDGEPPSGDAEEPAPHGNDVVDHEGYQCFPRW